MFPLIIFNTVYTFLIQDKKSGGFLALSRSRNVIGKHGAEKALRLYRLPSALDPISENFFLEGENFVLNYNRINKKINVEIYSDDLNQRFRFLRDSLNRLQIMNGKNNFVYFDEDTNRFTAGPLTENLHQGFDIYQNDGFTLCKNVVAQEFHGTEQHEKKEKDDIGETDEINENEERHGKDTKSEKTTIHTSNIISSNNYSGFPHQKSGVSINEHTNYFKFRPKKNRFGV